MKLTKNRFIPTAAMAAFASLASHHAAYSETYYWDADGATTAGFTTAPTGTWGTSPFWSTDITGSTNGTNATITGTDDVNFGTATSGFSTASIVAFSAPQSVRSITFGAGNTNTLTFSATGGGPLTLGSGSVITNNSASSVTFQGQLAGTNGFQKAGTGSVILTGTGVTGTGSGSTIRGAITVSAGTLQLNNTALTNATSVAINGGTLILASTAANMVGGTISFGGGTLQYNQNPGTDYSAQFSTAANQQYRINVITAAGPPVVARVATFSSVLSSVGGTLTKTGAGTLILAADNTFTGATTMSAGTLQLNNALALQNSAIDTAASTTGDNTRGILLNGVTSPTFGGLTGDKALASLFRTDTTNPNPTNYGLVTNVTLNPGTGASHSYSGVIADGATGMTLTKTGAGTQTLTGPNSYTGATTVSAGTLTLGASGVIADSSVVNLNAGTLNTTDGVVESLHSIQATTGTLRLGNTDTAGSADITLLNNSVLHNINVGLNGTLRLAADKTLTQTATGTTGQLAAGDTFTLNIGSGALAHLSGAINSGGGDGAVIKTGSGTLRVTASNSQWGGNTLIDNGTLEFNTIANYDVASSLGDGDNAGANNAIIRIGSATTAATLKMIETQAANSSNRAFQLGDAGGTIEVVESTQTFTLSGIVSNAGTSGALTKTGAGKLVLSGTTNSYTGGTIINAGTLNYGNASALSNGPITFTGGSILQAGVATTLANDIILNENVVGTVGTAGFATTLSGAITGAGTLVKGGGGVLTLTGGLENTISGGFQVNTGRLVVNDGLSLTNTGPVTVLSGASLNYSKNFTANNLTNNITLSGSGDGTFGALNLWGGADATGTITLAADASISHDFNAATISGSITGTNRNLTLRTLTTTVAQPGMVVSAPISLGTGSLTVTGVANTGGYSIRLTGDNSYSGGTTVTAGTLQVNNTTGSGTGSGTVTVNSGATLGGTGRISGAVNVSGVLSPGASVESLGTGTLTLISASTFKYEVDTSTVDADLLHVTGGLNIDSNVTLDLTDLANLSQALAVGTKFTLFSYTGIWNDGTFSGYADDSTFLFASNEWRINYNDLTGGSNFTSEQTGANGFVTLTVIPEPSSLGLLGLGGVGALLVRRSRPN